MVKQLIIGSFNIRYGDADDKLNSWKYRKDLIIENLSNNLPDIVGFQEVLPYVKEYLIENLPQYSIVGAGRGAKLDGENNCIAFKKDKFELISLETVWLSDTPYMQGSHFKNNDSCPRISTVVTLCVKEYNQLIRVFNTHLDYRYPHIRIKQLGVLNNFIKEYETKISLPTFITGDLNCTPDSKEIKYILNDFCIKLNDLSSIKNIKQNITYHDYFSGNESPCKIDYIFASNNINLIKSYADTTEKNGVYLSDHYPIYSVVEI